ncbi:DUF2786 domain-containing protein [Tistrella bauzanensis]|uniref:DUF7168 domain-containing protein n=1 Tax=Tistrella TaxID=171436 RepID=UPI0031F68A63
MSSTDLARIRARIQALRAMTVDRGCTEAEAIAAAVKAAELLSTHGLTEAELDTALAEALEVELGGRRSPLDDIWPVVAMFADCRGYFGGGHGPRTYVYFGEPGSVLVAEYVHQVIRRAGGDALAAFRATAAYRRRRSPRTRAAVAKAFAEGFSSSVRAALLEGLWRRKELDFGAPAEGFAQIKAGLAPLDAEMARRGIALQSMRALTPATKTGVRGLGGAHGAGARAGRAVRVDAPLEGSAAPAGLLGGAQ